MSLAEGVLALIEDARRRQPFARVRAVQLEIGALAGVEPEAMRFCFDAVTRGTVAEGARLEIRGAPGQGSCMGCGAVVEMRELYGDCPRCGSAQVQVTGGTELRVSELEVD
ncbi:MAG TPA: hydrogenase maturation nickel metallochaperone HypA [Ramlibacter sp.]|uniref:hydrogenase maturation nickel metallochaperone HypA n=1 Tax=Ramlibacter sp. TaxID=1917967 RepID=UPI002D7EF58F|nr:hydrogenase maturation nickel metallochaperone HypA [Ramlibacter sp.]HET8746365.1 hydrogenase maturation nickel metallochaperone HypA [Ramlibacter sp.]